MSTTTATVQTALRNHLVAAGLVRKPSAAGSLPPMHIEPRPGPLAPGGRFDKNDADATRETAGELVVSLRLSSEPARGIVDLSLRSAVFDLVYRSKGSTGMLAGRRLNDRIADLVVIPAGLGQSFTLNPAGVASPTAANPRLHATAIQTYSGIGPVGDEDGVHTDVCKLLVEWAR